MIINGSKKINKNNNNYILYSFIYIALGAMTYKL